MNARREMKELVKAHFLNSNQDSKNKSSLLQNTTPSKSISNNNYKTSLFLIFQMMPNREKVA